MATLIESDLLVTLSSRWHWRKYDNHTFYRGLAGAGLKGVDLIALLPDGRLALIEFKNYHPRTRRGKTHPVKLKKVARLTDTLVRKHQDSLRAIRVIDRYYQSKWYYRWRTKLTRFFPLLPTDDPGFWTEAARRAQGPLPVVILLWLETPAVQPAYRNQLYAHLAAKLDPERSQFLMDGNGLDPIPGITVSLLGEDS